jgi:hypothetical protein
MKSKLAEQCRAEMVEICRRMTPDDRLQAVVNHLKAMAEIYRAGDATRREQQGASLLSRSNS